MNLVNFTSLYKLKRRVASLPPVSATLFEQRAISTYDISQERGETTFHETCDVCNKVLHSNQKYQSHLRSQNHARNVAGQDTQDFSTIHDDTAVDEIGGLSLWVERPQELSAAAAEEEEEEEEVFNSSNCHFCLATSLDMIVEVGFKLIFIIG